MRVRKRSEARRGGAVVEMAAVAPILALVILGLIETSRLGMVTQLLTNAAREGARVAITSGTTQADVQNRVTAVLAGTGIPVPTAAPTPAGFDGTPTTAPRGTPITLTLSVSYSQVSWLAVPQFLGSASVTTTATFNSERNF